MPSENSTKAKIVFVDRDGVINVDLIGDYIKTWEEFRFEPGALDALKALQRKGFEIIIISNQAGIGDGVYPETALWTIHNNMLTELEKEGIAIKSSAYCLHGKKAGCECRKPKPGLFHRVAKDISFDATQTYFIGDKVSDIQAGKSFGLKTILVRTGHGAAEEKKLTADCQPDMIADNLKAAVECLT